MKVRWISRQFTRFDLALTKLSRPLTAINALSNLTVAVVVGLFLFGVFALVGFLAIALLGYGLHKSGFFMETMKENFDQQVKELWYPQQRVLAGEIVTCQKMSEKELEEYITEAKKELKI